MKLSEIYHSQPVSEPEDLEESDYTSLQISSVVKFAHGEQMEEAFAQLAQLPQFAAALEKGMARLVQQTIQQFVRESDIMPGHGWTDDYSVEVQVHPRENDFN